MIMLVERFVYECRIKAHDENMLESNGQGSNNSQPAQANKDQKQTGKE